MQAANPSTTATIGAKVSTLTTEHPKDDKFRILSLDGGGAKGFYTLGVLREIEAVLNCPLYKRFDLVFGTSTGAIIAALIALGYEVDEIHKLYKAHVPDVMRRRLAFTKTRALARLSKEVFNDKQFTDLKTGIGIVATKWIMEQPMIFKTSVAQAHGRTSTFVPGFGVSIADAVQASCSAYPFFKRKTVTTAVGETQFELIDGGFCANNPTLYAIADATVAMQQVHAAVRVISIGVGVYPEPKRRLIYRIVYKMLVSLRLLQKTLEINTQSMEALRSVLYKDIPTVRINEKYERPEMATDLMEYNMDKLNLLYSRGRESFAAHEQTIRKFLL